MADAGPVKLVVDHRGRGLRIDLDRALVPQHAGGHEHQIDVAEPIEDLVGEGLVPTGLGGVEGHRLGQVGSGRLGPVGRLGEADALGGRPG